MGRRVTITAGSLAIAVTMALTACGSLGRSRDPGDGTKELKETVAATAGAPEELGAPIGSRDIQISDSGKLFPVKVELYPLRRDQGFVAVNVRLTRTDATGNSDRWQISSAFQGDTVSLAFSGVTMIDRKNRKRHLVARSGDQDAKPGQVNYLASSGLASVFVLAGQSVDLYAMLGAPPDDVTAVDVVIPRVPVFENVPLG
ncbi:hypothetical protein [Micromonospora sp. NPDC005189]|uniref:hypothetical protein n=1 Tax=unclassified Micromonospora TaxID=2617518 RepID=UPI00339FD679